MLCGTAYRNKGVQMLLDAVIEYMPSPVDVPAIKGINPDTDEEDERPSSDDARSLLLHSRLQLTHLLVRFVSSEYTQVLLKRVHMY